MKNLKMISLFFFLRFLLGLTVDVIACIYVYKIRITGYSSSRKQSRAKLARSPIVIATASNVLSDSEMKITAGAKATLEAFTKHVSVFVIAPVEDASQVNALHSQMEPEFQGLIPHNHILYAQTGLGRVITAK
jgi:hypothetical protein